MSRAAMYTTWIGIGLLLTAGIHYYVWARLVADLRLPTATHRGLSVLMVLLAASVPATFIFGRWATTDMRKVLLLAGYTWMGIVFLLLSAIVITDLMRAVGYLAQRVVVDVPPAEPERRVTMARLFAAGVGVFAGGCTAFGLRSGLYQVIVRQVEVRLSRLPPELDGTTIVQLSDIHVGPTIGADFVKRVVAQANALDPDVIAITGDLVDGSVRRLRHLVAPLAELRARHGVFFVTGNHEYYSGAESWCREIERLGIRVLRNERVEIGNGQASFDLAGIDDYHAHRFGNGHGADLARAVAGRDESRELVLLAHQPRAVFEAGRHGVGLQLSGHTHGGQIWPWNYFVKLQQPVVSGLARIGRALVYVSNGTGYWGPPMRVGAPAEVTRVKLLSGRA